jgi:hypothetical protein
MPALVGTADVDLEEGAGELLLFPGRGRFAGAQPDDHVLRLRRLSGAKGKIADDPIALVEQADHRDPLVHRREALISDLGLRGRSRLLRILLLRLFAAVAGRQCQRADDQRCCREAHAQSGIHGW